MCNENENIVNENVRDRKLRKQNTAPDKIASFYFSLEKINDGHDFWTQKKKEKRSPLGFDWHKKLN